MAHANDIPTAFQTKVREQLDYELTLIAELKYEAYFLTVWDLVRFARSRGHSLPRARLGGQLGRLLLLGRYVGRPRTHRHAV